MPTGSVGEPDSRDSFDGVLLVYGVVIGPVATLLAAAVATLVGATRTLTMVTAIAAVALAGLCAGPALKKLRAPTWR